jgi:hypothetical protein
MVLFLFKMRKKFLIERDESLKVEKLSLAASDRYFRIEDVVRKYDFKS